MTTSNFIEYVTKDGDRLDTIANKCFGNPFLWKPIIEANPSLPLQDVYLAGTRLAIPVQKVESDSSVNLLKLPPWKR